MREVVIAWRVCARCMISWAWPRYDPQTCPNCGQPTTLQADPL